MKDQKGGEIEKETGQTEKSKEEKEIDQFIELAQFKIKKMEQNIELLRFMQERYRLNKEKANDPNFVYLSEEIWHENFGEWLHELTNEGDMNHSLRKIKSWVEEDEKQSKR